MGEETEGGMFDRFCRIQGVLSKRKAPPLPLHPAEAALREIDRGDACPPIDAQERKGTDTP